MLRIDKIKELLLALADAKLVDSYIHLQRRSSVGGSRKSAILLFSSIVISDGHGSYFNLYIIHHCLYLFDSPTEFCFKCRLFGFIQYFSEFSFFFKISFHCHIRHTSWLSFVSLLIG